jgi:hypothetical protein
MDMVILLIPSVHWALLGTFRGDSSTPLMAWEKIIAASGE